jgi:hypothetical protein
VRPKGRSRGQGQPRRRASPYQTPARGPQAPRMETASRFKRPTFRRPRRSSGRPTRSAPSFLTPARDRECWPRQAPSKRARATGCARLRDSGQDGRHHSPGRDQEVKRHPAQCNRSDLPRFQGAQGLQQDRACYVPIGELSIEISGPAQEPSTIFVEAPQAACHARRIRISRSDSSNLRAAEWPPKCPNARRFSRSESGRDRNTPWGARRTCPH